MHARISPFLTAPPSDWLRSCVVSGTALRAVAHDRWRIGRVDVSQREYDCQEVGRCETSTSGSNWAGCWHMNAPPGLERAVIGGVNPRNRQPGGWGGGGGGGGGGLVSIQKIATINVMWSLRTRKPPTSHKKRAKCVRYNVYSRVLTIYRWRFCLEHRGRCLINMYVCNINTIRTSNPNGVFPGHNGYQRNEILCLMNINYSNNCWFVTIIKNSVSNWLVMPID